MSTIFEQFDQVRVINVVERVDRRREVMAQLRRVGAADDPKLAFFAAHRPAGPGGFPSVGARGCFESHLSILRDALASDARRLLIVEDDFDFAVDVGTRGAAVMGRLADEPWDLFYGAPGLDADQDRRLVADAHGLAIMPPDMPILTTPFVAFSRAAIEQLEHYLTAMLGRPAGSPDYGPMHVDGAYSVFRQHHPHVRTLVAKPAIGHQRSSRSDIADDQFVLDRFALTRPLANQLRRAKDWIRR